MIADGSELTTVRRPHTNDRIRIDSHNLSQVCLLNFGDRYTAPGRNLILGERAEGSADQTVALPELIVMTSI